MIAYTNFDLATNLHLHPTDSAHEICIWRMRHIPTLKCFKEFSGISVVFMLEGKINGVTEEEVSANCLYFCFIS